MKRILAFDFGASSGRAIMAYYDNKKITYKEVHRFDNIPIEDNGNLYWDFKSLMHNVYEGIDKAGEFDSIGFDTWGVDYGLLDEKGKLIGNPFHYRDKRTVEAKAAALLNINAVELYEKTGNQIMNINTLFQLIAENRKNAKTLLFMPDLFAYMLCGKKVCEESILSTSQLYSPVERKISYDILNEFNIDAGLFSDVVQSGTIIGEYKNAKVISVAGHDTQCAVAATPSAKGENVAFLSCGTWSLLGTELSEPVLSQESMNEQLSNEIGANGKIDYLKNIIGLWLIQESRREFKRQGNEYSYSELEAMALKEKPLQCFIDPDADEFSTPGNIPLRVEEFCKRTGQYVPKTVGEIMRCIYESLALKYRFALLQIQNITQKKFEKLHLLGGGAKDRLLCQMTADSCGIPVIAGPKEATALGNIIVQLKALGEIDSIQEGREIVGKSEELKCFVPSDTKLWDKAYKSYINILK